MRTWTNSDGKPLVASVTDIQEGKVTFRLRNGKTIPYEISKLSEKDQELIKAKLEE